MKALLVFVMVVAIIGLTSISIIPLADAKTYFPANEYRTPIPPRYCIIDPPGYDESEKTRLFDITQNAIKEWNDELANFVQKYDSHPLLWEINSTVMKKSEFNNGVCEIRVTFTDDEKPNDDGFTLGFFEYYIGQVNGDIEIFTKDMNDDALRVVALHEVGHSLSLGHYVSDDNDQNERWRTQAKLAPSIMIPSINVNPELQKITESDLLKILNIYGKNGFYAFSNKPIPSLPPTSAPENPPKTQIIPEMPKIPVKPFEFVGIEKPLIKLSDYETEMISFRGQIKDAEFFKGHNVVLSIQYPTGEVVVHKTKPSNSGYFEIPVMFDGKTFPDGIYVVQPSYMENTDTSMTFEFAINVTLQSDILSDEIEHPDEIKYDEMDAEFLTTYKNDELHFQIDIPKTWVIEEDDNSIWFFPGKQKNKSNLLHISYHADPIIEMSMDEKLVANERLLRTVCTNNEHCTNFKFVESFSEKTTNGFENIINYEFEIRTNVEELGIGASASIGQTQNIVKFREVNMGNESWTLQYLFESETIEKISNMIINIDSTFNANPTSLIIPSWIKNNAAWWAEDQIDDNSFVQGIQFMIEENIISIPNLSESSSESADSVPAWIKNNAAWWAEGQIDDNSFVQGIEYLVKVGIIQIN
jgi:hypothetical protein